MTPSMMTILAMQTTGHIPLPGTHFLRNVHQCNDLPGRCAFVVCYQYRMLPSSVTTIPTDPIPHMASPHKLSPHSQHHHSGLHQDSSIWTVTFHLFHRLRGRCSTRSIQPKFLRMRQFDYTDVVQHFRRCIVPWRKCGNVARHQFHKLLNIATIRPSSTIQVIQVTVVDKLVVVLAVLVVATYIQELAVQDS